ncbi:MAG: hypothetical protein LBM94_00270 [Propionibacteriaceae bacterium]|jgi:hypothetical protein|nr:hypothetical protein [Propionibacteriaceae bacterium]
MATNKTSVSVAETGRGPKKVYTPSPEEQSRANTFRLTAALLWVLALGAEAACIFWALKQVPIVLWQVIALLVLDAVLAIGGSLLWKRSNKLDPPSRANGLTFWLQSQLGLIVAVLAFLPLIVVVLLSGNLSTKEKGIIAGVAGVLLVVTGLFGVDWNPVSAEQYNQEVAVVMAVNGENEVFWVKNGSVYHLCEESSDLQRDSADGNVYNGTVAAAHENGMQRLANRKECGYDPNNPPDVTDWLPGGGLFDQITAPQDTP